MSPRAVLVNLYEHLADRELRKVCDRHGARVLPKVRVADAVDVDEQQLSSIEHRYALSAHLDFLVIDDASLPLFAVELDGKAAHATAHQQQSDRMKNRICERGGLELLRVDTPFLGTFGRYRVLSYLASSWFLFRAFEEAQERGDVPRDEPLDPKSFITPDPSGLGVNWTYAVDMPVRSRIQKLHQAGQLPDPWPRQGSLVQHADDADVAAYVLLRLPQDLYLLAEATVRSFRFRAGLAPSEIAEDLAMLELDGLLDGYLRGDAVAVDNRAVEALRVRTQGHEWLHHGLLVEGWPS